MKSMATGHLVFVFGTLKDGFPNFATNRGTRLPGAFRTCSAYPLYLVGYRHVPWLLPEGSRPAGRLRSPRRAACGVHAGTRGPVPSPDRVTRGCCAQATFAPSPAVRTIAVLAPRP